MYKIAASKFYKMCKYHNESGTRKIHGVHITECRTKKNEDTAKKLLNESFAKQDDGTFNQEYLMNFIPQMLELIKPENEHVKNIMMNYKH